MTWTESVSEPSRRRAGGPALPAPPALPALPAPPALPGPAAPGDSCPKRSTTHRAETAITFAFSTTTRREAQARLLPCDSQVSMNTDVYSPREIALAAGV